MGSRLFLRSRPDAPRHRRLARQRRAHQRRPVRLGDFRVEFGPSGGCGNEQRRPPQQLHAARRDDGVHDGPAAPRLLFSERSGHAGPRAPHVVRAVRNVPRRHALERRAARSLRRRTRGRFATQLRGGAGLPGIVPVPRGAGHPDRAQRSARRSARCSRCTAPRAERSTTDDDEPRSSNARRSGRRR